MAFRDLGSWSDDKSPLVELADFAANGTTVMTNTKGYDFVNRLPPELLPPSGCPQYLVYNFSPD